jgi:hypothetical protein
LCVCVEFAQDGPRFVISVDSAAPRVTPVRADRSKPHTPGQGVDTRARLGTHTLTDGATSGPGGGPGVAFVNAQVARDPMKPVAVNMAQYPFAQVHMGTCWPIPPRVCSVLSVILSCAHTPSSFAGSVRCRLQLSSSQADGSQPAYALPGVMDVNPNALYPDLEEKPWRKPGADITAWFNYGYASFVAQVVVLQAKTRFV